MTRKFFTTHDERAYTTAEVIEKIRISRSTFFWLKRRGELPLEELTPRLGRIVRYRAAPIDRWLSGRGMQRRAS